MTQPQACDHLAGLLAPLPKPNCYRLNQVGVLKLQLSKLSLVAQLGHPMNTQRKLISVQRVTVSIQLYRGEKHEKQNKGYCVSTYLNFSHGYPTKPKTGPGLQT